MPEHDMADLLAGRGATLDLNDGDMVTDAVILCRVSKADGKTSLGMAITEGTGWLDQYGLVHAAGNVLDQAGWHTEED